MLRRPDGAVLLATRPPGKAFEGWWEFPGGKIESYETPRQALIRECQEEIGIRALELTSAWTIRHSYPHAEVELHFHWVNRWIGTPKPIEGQQLLWVGIDQAWPYPVLPATVPLLQRIRNYKA
ncbi:MAG: NUDIX domain-containing protein [Betaproteobacteria bacterium]|nr:NUDIX domain-containing protein [Betaproteobacteria bacterium]